GLDDLAGVVVQFLALSIGVSSLALHDALPISGTAPARAPSTRRSTAVSILSFSGVPVPCALTKSTASPPTPAAASAPRTACSSRSESTRLNSSHLGTSYAVFCLKKKRTPSEFP